MSRRSSPDLTFEERLLHRASLEFVTRRWKNFALYGDLGLAAKLVALLEDHHRALVTCIFTDDPAVSEIQGIPVLGTAQRPDGFELLLVCAERDEAALMRRAREWAGPEAQLFAAVSDAMRLPALRAGLPESNGAWPSRMYVLCSGERTGSTLLSGLLRDTGVLGLPAEYFRLFLANHVDRGVVTYADLVPDLFKRLQTANGIFGVKIHGYQYPVFQKAVGSLRVEDKQCADELVANAAYVFLTRENMYRQAISLWRAHETNIYHVFQPGLKARVKNVLRARRREVRIAASETLLTAARKHPAYRYGAIKNALAQVVEQRATWETFFKSRDVEPLRVTYETLVADTAGALGRIADHVGVDLPEERKAIRPRSRKMADGYSETVLKRFVPDLRNDDPDLMDRVESLD